MMHPPVYVVFAGVNGAGKSTFYRSGTWGDGSMPRSMLRVNPDEILREEGLDWRSRSAQVEAGRQALALVDDAFSHGWSLNQETTLAGHVALKQLARARDLGYRIVLYYIGVPDADVAQRRIANRVGFGGHDIDPAIVQRRFRASLSNLSCAISLCDEVFLYDNSVAFKLIALWKNDLIRWWGVTPQQGGWFLEALHDEEVWRRGID